MSKGDSRGLGAVLLGASILGFAAIFVKWSAAGGATPITTGFYRMLFALPGTFLLAYRTGDVLGDAGGRRWALIAGGLFFADLWLWHLAMHHTGAANATLLVGGLSPIWVALFSFAFLRLRRTRSRLALAGNHGLQTSAADRTRNRIGRVHCAAHRTADVGHRQSP